MFNTPVLIDVETLSGFKSSLHKNSSIRLIDTNIFIIQIKQVLYYISLFWCSVYCLLSINDRLLKCPEIRMRCKETSLP